MVGVADEDPGLWISPKFLKVWKLPQGCLLVIELLLDVGGPRRRR
jgi:hypothetical protein